MLAPRRSRITITSSRLGCFFGGRSVTFGPGGSVVRPAAVAAAAIAPAHAFVSKSPNAFPGIINITLHLCHKGSILAASPFILPSSFWTAESLAEAVDIYFFLFFFLCSRFLLRQFVLALFDIC